MLENFTRRLLPRSKETANEIETYSSGLGNTKLDPGTLPKPSSDEDSSTGKSGTGESIEADLTSPQMQAPIHLTVTQMIILRDAQSILPWLRPRASEHDTMMRRGRSSSGSITSIEP